MYNLCLHCLSLRYAVTVGLVHQVSLSSSTAHITSLLLLPSVPGRYCPHAYPYTILVTTMAHAFTALYASNTCERICFTTAVKICLGCFLNILLTITLDFIMPSFCYNSMSARCLTLSSTGILLLWHIEKGQQVL